MSYDLMVFDSQSAPKERAAFLEWYQEQSDWAEGHSYDDPNVTSSQLQAWFWAMTRDFPPMNGPHAARGDESDRVSDYCIGRHVIYVAFAWSMAESAYAAMIGNARKCRVGFYDVSGENGEVWVPKGEREYVCLHSNAQG